MTICEVKNNAVFFYRRACERKMMVIYFLYIESGNRRESFFGRLPLTYTQHSYSPCFIKQETISITITPLSLQVALFNVVTQCTSGSLPNLHYIIMSRLVSNSETRFFFWICMSLFIGLQLRSMYCRGQLINLKQ